MRVGSLFAGIGGFDLAAERAGMTIVWQSEIDPHASRVLAHHWSTTPNLGDIHDITDPPAVDVLTGGFPCQDYSTAGRGNGLAGDRGALWWQFHRLIAELHPAWVVGENVDSLVHRRHRRDFATIIDSLVALGYGVVWRVLDARYFGVPHRRRRIFIVGHSGGRPRPEVLDLAAGVSGDTGSGREKGEVVATLTASSLGGGGPDDNLARAGHLVVNARQHPITLEDQCGPLDTHATWAVAENQHGEVRLSESGLALTTGGGKPGQGYPAALTQGRVRMLTPLECERLQGFPDGWTDIPGNSDSQRYRQLGNAVTVPVVKWIMQQIGESHRRAGTAEHMTTRLRLGLMA